MFLKIIIGSSRGAVWMYSICKEKKTKISREESVYNMDIIVQY